MSPLMMTPRDKRDFPLSSIPIFIIPILPTIPNALRVASSFSEVFVDDKPVLICFDSLFLRKKASVLTIPPPSDSYLNDFILTFLFQIFHHIY